MANLSDFVYTQVEIANVNVAIDRSQYAADTANAAFDAANNAVTDFSSVFNQANLAYAQANAAFASSNTKLSASGGTITGNLSITGSLSVAGNAYIIDSETLRVSDPLIYLAGNNYTSDIVDIGFVGNYVNVTGQNVHTGFFRNHEDKEYYVFQEYDQEPTPNHIDVAGNNFTLAVLNSTVKTSNLILGGANAIVTIGRAFDRANSATTTANNALPNTSNYQM